MQNSKLHRPYVGRFAPSPSGPLHFGSLLTAIASYLDARAQGGQWRVRIDDIDPPRTPKGAADGILRTLEAFGLLWDGPVIYQSQHSDRYEAIVSLLAEQGDLYYCTCTRAQLKGLSQYPGTCRHQIKRIEGAALRIHMPQQTFSLDDRLQGHCLYPADQQSDWIIKRKDGLWAYQFATAIDDTQDQITDVVRGIDLLDTTYRQCWLQSLLQRPSPRYAHLPVVVGTDGRKLSKQNWARPVDALSQTHCLQAAGELLGLGHSDRMEPGDWLTWATLKWDINRLVGVRRLAEPQFPV